MHLLATRPGSVEEATAAVDLDQSPGDIVVLSAADTELACLAAARRGMGEGYPRLRLANLLRLGHPLSVDLYLEKTARHARLIVARLLGGRGYWPYGVDQLAALAAEQGIGLALLPGDDQPDGDLARLSTLPPEAAHRLWQYLVHGGPANAAAFLGYGASLIGQPLPWQEPRPLLRQGFHWPGLAEPDLAAVRARWAPDRPVAAIVFYRALLQAGTLQAIDGLTDALAASGLNPLPIYVMSLKEPATRTLLSAWLAETGAAAVLNTTGFALGNADSDGYRTIADGFDGPVLQVTLASTTEAAWREGSAGLPSRDVAMGIALPEIDGRIITRAVGFKGEAVRDPLTEADIPGASAVADRLAFVADLAANLARLAATPAADRRVALVLANYPHRDGRLGNGVGLDTPASTVAILRALAHAGYAVDGIPENGNALIERLAAGPTNALGPASPAGPADRIISEVLPLAEYRMFFDSLPAAVKAQVTDRWGAPESDPHFRPGAAGGFAIAAFRCGNTCVALQPARGYHIDPVSSYHDPGLPPPHAYLAFYAWIRRAFAAHAVVHVGKHGNLEWLPGKGVALSAECFPDAILGPTPHLYPFIVNDPGEGTQAKRRAQAVIVDHLTPPMTRAESYGPLRDLERLVDEYFEAETMDRRRLPMLADEIVALARATGIDRDCGMVDDDRAPDALAKLDGFLCEIKEMQIRDGLHVLGSAPAGRQLRDLLVALARLPRGDGQGTNQSLLRALADDLGLAFDPLAADLAAPWQGLRPACLKDDGAAWRTAGDTVERLEALAAALVAGDHPPESCWTQSKSVLEAVDGALRPAVLASGPAEIAGLLRGLDGRFVPPGPSGAPTRGRPEVLPTGRNFFSVDVRAVPTQAAWRLGWKSASLLVERYVQEHGEWPRTMAITAWGTSNMRTGGDDIAQALALMGVRPAWDAGTGRVTGFEILPADVLGRPRVDVTVRISGFFRDAFAGVVALLDAAVRAVAALDEPAEANPLAEASAREETELRAAGVAAADARRQATWRVFGSKPGAYGAGLQALIDEKGWQTDADLARAYVVWGGYAYGAGGEGTAAHATFEQRLSGVEAVVQNQDNREHDVLDSDDYYQFEGGMTAAVRTLSGQQPAVFHADHARPDRPVIRTLDEEIARVVRARVVNPKWIEGVMRHGYKGAFEMAATVDYLFAFAATARCVSDHHFDAVFHAYLDDDAVRDFIEENNPAALKEMSDRLLEAEARGLWRPRANHAVDTLRRLAGGG